MIMLAAATLFSAALQAPPRAGRLHAPAIVAGPDLRSPEARGIASEVAHARGVRDFGHLDGRTTVAVGVLLHVRRQEELERLTLLQGQRGSPVYHHYLTTAQFNNYFAPDQVTYAHALATLQRHGFRIAQTYGNRGFVRAEAPASTVERYFSTSLHAMYQAGAGFRYANVTPARMPDDLRGLAVSVSGLHTIQTMHHPIHFADKALVRASAYYAYASQQVAAEARRPKAPARVAQSGTRRPANVPTPIASSTPSAAQPGPDPTLSPGNPSTDFTNSTGAYDPTIYAAAYDYPVDHGYGGRNHPAGNVIEADFLTSDADKEFSAFAIPRSGKAYRYCGVSGGGADCFGTIGQSDPVGESTLDALTIMSLAPASDLYVYIAPAFDDIQIESAYETALNQDIVEAVNSSFGGCETDDPSFGYATNYIAMEGASLGITFVASTGDTGSTNCGTYAQNGAPQTAVNVSIPSANYYFTALGGTDFYPLQSCGGVGSCYTRETAWTFGGGGSSVYEPIPSWQQPAVQAQSNVAEVSTTMRNTPDLVFTADFLPPGVGIEIYHNGAVGAVGGTSVASPMFTALQVTINQVQNSRNGWVNPGLYDVFNKFASFAYRDIVGGSNGRFQAVPGFDDASGMGSPLGWELAGVENGSAGLPARPNPTPAPQPPTPTPTIGPTPTPTPVIVPSPVGTSFSVTTIAGKACSSGVPDPKATQGALSLNVAADCYNSPTGIVYTATGQGADAFLFISDFGSGYLRGIDLVTNKVTTYNDITWNNATRAAGGVQASNLYGLTVGGTTNNAGLYVTSSGDSTVNQIVLPTSPDPAATPHSRTRAEAGTSTIVFDVTGNNAYDTAANNGNLYAIEFAPSGGPVSTLTFTAASTLPPTGGFGLTVDNMNPQNLVITSDRTNALFKATESPQQSMVSAFVSGAPLNLPEEITQLNGTFYVANCGGNNIVKITSAGVMSVVAGDGAGRELDGFNTGAEFNCPFGITNDGTNLYVTDLGGNTIRKISGLQ